ncbi:patatin-like phospholipase family protein [Alteromonas sp. A081]|uniref:patatin-like phospholipase family protein n=1 Tax=Alteromonas sp. A081 TaxID=3410269 RepID=UPI003B987496
MDVVTRDKSKALFGMALSGGGVRGFAHIGVYKAMLERGIKPEIIAGSSMGALIGALIATGYSPEELIKIANNSTKARLFVPQLPRLGISSHGPIRKLLTELIPETFDKLLIPLHVSTTNLNTGENTMWSDGNLIDAVMASTCIPVAFVPVEINGMQYVDGGLSRNMPAAAIRDNCVTLIGSHANYIDTSAKLESLTAIMERCFRIAIHNTVRDDMQLCDLYINPPEIRHFSTLKFDHINDIIELGYTTCKTQLEQLHN